MYVYTRIIKQKRGWFDNHGQKNLCQQAKVKVVEFVVQDSTPRAVKETVEAVLSTSDSETAVTLLLAKPFSRPFESTGLWLSVGGGVGGAPPTTGALPCSKFVSDRFTGSGEDL